MSFPRILSSLADLVFPPRCPLCGDFHSEGFAPCSRCARRVHLLEGDAHVELPWRVWLGRARSCFAHEEPVRHALWSFKYEGAMHAFEFFRTSLVQEARRMGGYDLVAPVPMQAGRVIARGIDAAHLLARDVAKVQGAAFDAGLLVRRRRARRQVGLTRGEGEERERGVRCEEETPGRGEGRKDPHRGRRHDHGRHAGRVREGHDACRRTLRGRADPRQGAVARKRRAFAVDLSG